MCASIRTWLEKLYHNFDRHFVYSLLDDVRFAHESDSEELAHISQNTIKNTKCAKRILANV